MGLLKLLVAGSLVYGGYQAYHISKYTSRVPAPPYPMLQKHPHEIFDCYEVAVPRAAFQKGMMESLYPTQPSSEHGTSSSNALSDESIDDSTLLSSSTPSAVSHPLSQEKPHLPHINSVIKSFFKSPALKPERWALGVLTGSPCSPRWINQARFNIGDSCLAWEVVEKPEDGNMVLMRWSAGQMYGYTYMSITEPDECSYNYGPRHVMDSHSTSHYNHREGASSTGGYLIVRFGSSIPRQIPRTSHNDHSHPISEGDPSAISAGPHPHDPSYCASAECNPWLARFHSMYSRALLYSTASTLLRSGYYHPVRCYGCHHPTQLYQPEVSNGNPNHLHHHHHYHHHHYHTTNQSNLALEEAAEEVADPPLPPVGLTVKDV